MRIVIKVGSGVLAAEDGTLQRQQVTRLADQVVALHELEHQVVIVSSGAVASGFRHLGFSEVPSDLPDRQACASVGQFFLIGAYEEVFSAHGFSAGLVLLTHEDIQDRRRYLNARNTIDTLLRRGAVPIVNENDAVAVEEILMGDNDQLAAMAAALVQADRLVLLTNVEGVYKGSPEEGGELYEQIDNPEAVLETIPASTSTMGRGGMRSKLQAAAKAASFGIETVIASGYRPGVLGRIAAGEQVGTRIPPSSRALNSRRFWIRFVTRPKGTLTVDQGAAKALVDDKKSLLPKGVTGVEGRFSAGDAVKIVDQAGRTLARGLTEYNNDEMQQILGLHSREIVEILGYKRTDEVIHRDDLVLES